MHHKRRIILLLPLLMAALLLTSCASQMKVSVKVTKVTSSTVFNLDFGLLNDTYTSTLIVPEDREIMAEINCEQGRIDMTITPEGGEPIYTGKQLPSSTFSIVPKTAGKYTVTISGENASGSVHVYVEGAVLDDDEPADGE